MTILDTFFMQPGETLDYDINYTANDLPADDTLNSATASWVNLDDAADVTSLNMGLCLYFNTPKKFSKTWLAGPDNGKRYKITVVATTVGGRTFEDEFVVRGRED